MQGAYFASLERAPDPPSGDLRTVQDVSGPVLHFSDRSPAHKSTFGSTLRDCSLSPAEFCEIPHVTPLLMINLVGCFYCSARVLLCMSAKHLRRRGQPLSQ